MRDEQQNQLIKRIQSGDLTAEDELFKKYKEPILWKVCRHIKTDIEEIKDLVSDIYLAILEAIRKESFQPQRWESLEACIWGVTNNKIRDWFKKKNREKKYFFDNPLPEEIAIAPKDYLLEKKELKKFLRLFLRALDPKYKEILDLRYFQELSVQEISERIGIPPRRVSERIHYALKLMRKECQKRNLLSMLRTLLLLYFQLDGIIKIGQ